MAVRYSTPQFLLKSMVRWYGTPFLEWYGYGTLVWYASKIELKYGTVRLKVQGTSYANSERTVRYRTAILGCWGWSDTEAGREIQVSWGCIQE